MLGAVSLRAQTFRGSINGTVVDQSNAVLAGAAITATNNGTGVALNTVSSSGGEYAFQDLPLGTYTVSVTAAGFKAEKIDAVPVTAGTIYTLPVKMAVSSTAETVEVMANALALDTTSTTQNRGSGRQASAGHAAERP